MVSRPVTIRWWYIYFPKCLTIVSITSIGLDSSWEESHSLQNWCCPNSIIEARWIRTRLNSGSLFLEVNIHKSLIVTFSPEINIVDIRLPLIDARFSPNLESMMTVSMWLSLEKSKSAFDNPNKPPIKDFTYLIRLNT